MKSNNKKIKIILAKNISFCGGVSWAVNQVFDLQKKSDKPLIIFGELIHNHQFNQKLAQKNIETAHHLNQCQGKTAIIRSHGLPPKTEKDLRATAQKVIDLTCPNVKKVQQLVKKYSKKGYQILITGSENHPEVIGLRGYAIHSLVLENLQQAQKLKELSQGVLISQTTFSENLFLQIAQVLQKKFPKIKIENTLCAATRVRQKEVEDLAKQCDLLIIVGGKHSSNTKKLQERALNSGAKKVLLIETAQELNPQDFQKSMVVGIASGASTPLWLIEEVKQKIEQS